MTTLCVARPDDAAARALLDGLADDYARVEVKRMWTSPAHRRRGLARRLLEALEREALALGYGVLRLHTGARSHAAITLYETAGYCRIEPFGRYSAEPLAVAFEKRLA